MTYVIILVVAGIHSVKRRHGYAGALERYTPSPHTQKLQRVHAALRRLCAPFPINEMKIPPPRRRCTVVRRRGRSGNELLALNRLGLPLLDE